MRMWGFNDGCCEIRVFRFGGCFRSVSVWGGDWQPYPHGTGRRCGHMAASDFMAEVCLKACPSRPEMREPIGRDAVFLAEAFREMAG